MDCSKQDNLNFANQNLKVKSFPAILVFGVGEKSLAKKLYLPKSKKMSEITEEILDFIEDRAQNASPGDMNTILKELVENKKPVFFYFYEKDQDVLPFGIISQMSKYKSKFRLVKLRDPTDQIKSVIEIKKIPDLTISFFQDMKKTDHKFEDIKIAHYAGKHFSKEIYQFMDQFITYLEKPEPSKEPKFADEL